MTENIAITAVKIGVLPTCAQSQLVSALNQGNLIAIQALYRAKSVIVEPWHVRHAAALGHLNLVVYPDFKHHCVYLLRVVFDDCNYAANNCERPPLRRMVRWLMEEAVEHDKLHVLQWLHIQHGCLACEDEQPCDGDAPASLTVMDLAADYGRLDAVKWLHAHCPAGCTKAAIDKAAAENHMEIVVWLAKNRDEGCTSGAIDLAAASGHFHMVDFLIKHVPTATCTSAAMTFAAGRGHLTIVQLLYLERPEFFFIHTAIEIATLAGHTGIADWLQDASSADGICAELAKAHATQSINSARKSGGISASPFVATASPLFATASPLVATSSSAAVVVQENSSLNVSTKDSREIKDSREAIDRACKKRLDCSAAVKECTAKRDLALAALNAAEKALADAESASKVALEELKLAISH